MGDWANPSPCQGAKSCFPCLGCELIEVTDEAVNRELPLKRLDLSSFLRREPGRLRPDQVSVFVGFYDITNIDDVAVFGDWAKFRNGDSARTPGKHFLCDHRFDAEGPNLHRGSSNIPNDYNGPIVAIWHYSGNRDSRLRWLKSEGDPGEIGLLHRDHGSDLSERGVSGVPHCARGTSGLCDGISSIAFLTIRDVSGEVNGIAQASRLYAEDNSLPDKRKKLQCANYNERSSEPKIPPIGRRLGSSITFLLLAFCCCFLGGKYLCDDRPILGAAWFSAAVLSGLTAFALLWLLGLENTWGWWL